MTVPETDRDAEASKNGQRRKSSTFIGFGILLFLLLQLAVSLIPRGLFEFAYLPGASKNLFFSPLFGFTLEQAICYGLTLLLGTPALLFVTAGIAPLLRVGSLPPSLVKRAAVGAALAAVLFVGWTVFGLYRGRAIVDDELTYGLQAQLLSEGSLGFKRTPKLLLEPFLIEGKAGITGKYLFGEPLIQIIGVASGYPSLLHILLTALTFYFLYLTLSVLGDRQLAYWAVILLACSPMLLLISGNGQPQCSSLFCVVVAGLGYALVKTDRCWSGVMLLGAGIGLGMTIRPQAAAPFGTVLAAGAAWRLLKIRRPMPLAGLCLVLGGFAAALLCYNKAVTGSCLTLPWYLSEPVEHYGFGSVVSGGNFMHTPAKALYNLSIVLLRFNAWWLGWPSSLLLVVVWLIWGGPAAHSRVWLWAGLALIAFHIPYYSPGVSDAGPIYYYELLVPASMLGANAIVSGLRTRPALVISLLIVHFGLGTTAFLVHETARMHRLVEAIHKYPDSAFYKLPSGSILFYETDCSERIMVGWVVSAFPRRCFVDSCRVVTLPRPDGELIPAYLAAYPGRSCWFYRLNPETGAAELKSCSDAREMLSRPAQRRNICPMLRSSASKFGL